MSGTTGVNVWFNTGGSLKNATRVSEIRRIGKKNIGKSRKVYYFKGNHKKGMKVDLGIENQEYTVLIQDEASGVVNYK